MLWNTLVYFFVYVGEVVHEDGGVVVVLEVTVVGEILEDCL